MVWDSPVKFPANLAKEMRGLSYRLHETNGLDVFETNQYREWFEMVVVERMFMEC